MNLFSGRPADPPSDDFIMRNAMDSQEIAVGWWPGDPRYPRPAFYAYAHPAPPGFDTATLSPAAARWEPSLGEYVLDWDDVRSAPEPHRAALEFARSAVEHGCAVCDWDPESVRQPVGDAAAGPLSLVRGRAAGPANPCWVRKRRRRWRGRPRAAATGLVVDFHNEIGKSARRAPANRRRHRSTSGAQTSAPAASARFEAIRPALLSIIRPPGQDSTALEIPTTPQARPRRRRPGRAGGVATSPPSRSSPASPPPTHRVACNPVDRPT